ncbi:hypothetical protein Aple_013110 [Acrocarpospora pleiomorpha]|uniref:Uncharacterized protein n=1 Tax=Acrocarpospora pleiomorpha TaxID=90975 RepID=A0A5M3XCN3_9ACTN|nr:hypothetical protein Aple_013110 [Acrocarpospora pleiomorpha]
MCWVSGSPRAASSWSARRPRSWRTLDANKIEPIHKATTGTDGKATGAGGKYHGWGGEATGAGGQAITGAGGGQEFGPLCRLRLATSQMVITREEMSRSALDI